MANILPILFTLFFVLKHGNCAHWDFAVTTKTQIHFFDKHWNEITSSAHQFDDLSALALDETENVVYFSDKMHLNGSIFSLRLSNSQYQNYQQQEQIKHHVTTTTSDADIIEKIIQRTNNENIGAIAYDPLERKLYWTDSANRKIHYAIINNNNKDKDNDNENYDNIETKVLLDLSAEDAIPDGLAIDICRRKLYWTNKNFRNASIESIDLNNINNERQVIINNNLYLPHGIVVDQIDDRIYWVEDKQGMHYTVESSRLDGKERRAIVQGLNNVPMHLTITHDAIFWTDSIHNAVWSREKEILKLPPSTISQQEVFVDFQPLDSKANLNDEYMPYKVKSFDEQPYGIVGRTNFLTNLQHDEHCAAVISQIKNRLQNEKSQNVKNDERTASGIVKTVPYCLNGGEELMPSDKRAVCVCKMGWDGARCDTNICHNYCINGGNCSISATGAPMCVCPLGFYGRRCQAHKCSAHCLNDGICRINEIKNAPECECRDNFGGTRCEHNSTEICALYCRLLKHEPEIDVPFGCTDLCTELSALDGYANYELPKYKHLEVCKNMDSYANGTIIIVLTVGVVLCLTLILFIVHALRRVYKPARPRIKKTFVVRKETPRMSPDTPLTNRPTMATEQCEITIENCCNMNICETPCFDPKLVQQSLSSCDAHLKEDRIMLIHNMDDELY